MTNNKAILPCILYDAIYLQNTSTVFKALTCLEWSTVQHNKLLSVVHCSTCKKICSYSELVRTGRYFSQCWILSALKYSWPLNATL